MLTISLFDKDGAVVAEVAIPRSQWMPDVIVWESRYFLQRHGRGYIEGFAVHASQTDAGDAPTVP